MYAMQELAISSVYKLCVELGKSPLIVSWDEFLGDDDEWIGWPLPSSMCKTIHDFFMFP